MCSYKGESDDYMEFMHALYSCIYIINAGYLYHHHKKPKRHAVKLPSVCCNNNQHCRPPCASKLFEGAKQIYRARCLSPHAWAHHLPERDQSVGPHVPPLPTKLNLTFNRCLSLSLSPGGRKCLFNLTAS